MSAPKIAKGDRLRVTFETKAQNDEFGGEVAVALDDGMRIYVDVDQCEVLAPPIKVGDVVTPATIGQLGEKSVIARPNYQPSWRSYDGLWHSADGMSMTDDAVFNIPAESDTLRVLRIGGTS